MTKSKYKIRDEYKILNTKKPVHNDIYNLIRQLTKHRTTRTMSVALFDTTYESGTEVTIHLHIKHEHPKMSVKVPSPESTCPGTLLIRMGTHTLAELWDEYYDTWAAEIEAQVQDIPVGDGQW